MGALRFREVITRNVMTQLRHYGNLFLTPCNLNSSCTCTPTCATHSEGKLLLPISLMHPASGHRRICLFVTPII